MELKNYMERLVWSQLDEVLSAHDDLCKCERCRYDIAALALNMLPPYYVVTNRGEIFTKVKFLEQQFNIDIVTAITKASKIVGAKPHHDEQ